MDTAYF